MLHRYCFKLLDEYVEFNFRLQLPIKILFYNRELYVRTEENGRPEVLMLLHDVEQTGYFSALGFFEVNRGLLVTILGTVLTYFIILYQTITC